LERGESTGFAPETNATRAAVSVGAFGKLLHRTGFNRSDSNAGPDVSIYSERGARTEGGCIAPARGRGSGAARPKVVHGLLLKGTFSLNFDAGKIHSTFD
jgi:hypothetical protein